MKIGISITPVYNIKRELKNIDGIGAYTTHLSQALTHQNVSVKEIYFKKMGEIALSSAAFAKGNFHVSQNPIYSLLPGKFYKPIKNEIDLLHVTDYLVPRIKNVPIVSTIHDAIMLKYPDWLEGSKQVKLLKRTILKKLSCQADHIITCSQSSLSDIVNFWGIPEHKISITPYGLAPFWQEKIPLSTRQLILKKYQLDKPFFLSVGTLQPRKNIERMLTAFLQLPQRITSNFNLVLVGKDHPTLTSPTLLDKIAHYRSMGQLSWLKYVPIGDLCGIYQSAYAVLYPSLAEGFGYPILEGFASGVPVITSQGGSTEEIAGNAALLVDPYSVDSISEAMLNITEQPTLREQMIQKGSDQVKKFTWENCVEKTLGVYKKLL